MGSYQRLEIIYQRFDLFLQDHPIDTLDSSIQTYSLFKRWHNECFPEVMVPYRAFLIEYLREKGMDPNYIRDN